VELGVFGAPAKAEVFESYREAGFRRAVLSLPPASAEVVLPVLDRHAEVLAAFR
jgi:hypothetical protein